MKPLSPSPVARRRWRRRALFTTTLLFAALARAQIVADPKAPPDHRPTLLKTPNGKPLVNIQSPNAAGISHNLFQQFDVPPTGVVLNNSATPAPTQIGGWVPANPWLATGSARLILNEVTGQNPSLIQGPVEVAGQRADVIMANPAGISINGGSFINANRVTLTTGTPVFNGDQLSALRVDRGTVRVEGAGLDARQTSYTALLARAVEVVGQLHAQRLDVVAGAATVGVESGKVDLATPGRDTGPAPAVAIDIGQLGGMYAGHIRLLVTDAGAGVRHHGTLSASVGDVSISANGWLQSSGTVRAVGTVAVKGQAFIHQGQMDAARLDIEVASLVNEGRIRQAGAQGLQVKAGTLVNAAGASMGTIIDDAGNASSGTGSVGGSPAPGPSGTNTNPATGDASGTATGTPSTPALPDGQILVTNSLSNQAGGQLLSNGVMAVTTSQTLRNAGELRVDRLTAGGQALEQLGVLEVVDLQAHVDQLLLGGGRLWAGSAQLQTHGWKQAPDAALKVQNRLDLTVWGDLVSRKGEQVAVGGQLNLQVLDGRFDNAGQWTAGQQLNVQADHIDNRATGELLSLGTTTLDARQNPQGSVTNRGLVDGADTRVHSPTVNNLGTGRLYGDRVAIGAESLLNREETVNGQTSAATVAARDRLDIGASHFTNQEGAQVISAGDMAVGGALNGRFQAIADGSNNAATLYNRSATIESLGHMQLAAQELRNTNEHLTLGEVQQGPAESIVEYQGHGIGSGTRYRDGTPGVSVGWQEMPTSGSVLYVLNTPEFSGYGGGFEYPWTAYSYTRQTVVTTVLQSAPGRIAAGGNLSITGQSVLNDASHILAGGNIGITASNVTNTSVMGQKVETDSGWATLYWRNKRRGDDNTLASTSAFQETRTTQILLNVGRMESGASPGAPGSNAGTNPAGHVLQGVDGSGGTSPGNLPLPLGSLFKADPDSKARYLVETDPRFTNYRQWLSSDYMLSSLGLNPATTQKRLGDGFYEQKLLRDQVAGLTGQRFLGDFTSDEAQYLALMRAGSTFAQAQQLRPGVTLTAAQVAALTSDIVWLVTQTVQLPDGRTVEVLTPKLFLAPRAGDLSADGLLAGGGPGDGTGALISARNVQLALSGQLSNSGTLAGRELLDVQAGTIAHSGRMQADVALLSAEDRIRIEGGRVDAVSGLVVQAGKGLDIVTTTQSSRHTTAGSSTRQQNIDRKAGLYVSGPAGVLLAHSGGDMQLAGADIRNAGTGTTQLTADGSINVGTVQTGIERDITWTPRNRYSESRAEEVGSRITGGGSVVLQAQRDLSVRGAQVDAQGALQLRAVGGDVTIAAAEQSRRQNEDHQFKGKGFLSKKTTTIQRSNSRTDAVASELGGNSVSITSGGDTRITGSNVVAEQGLRIQADGNLNIGAAQNRSHSSSFVETRQSGLMSGGGAGFTIGKRQQSLRQQQESTTAAASTVGSVSGNVDLQAGRRYTQTGSDVLAPGGDITIAAQQIDITEARETQRSEVEQRFKQSGLSVSLGAPAVQAAQTMASTAQAVGQTRSNRMKALGAATLAMQGQELADQAGKTVDALQNGQGIAEASGLTLNVSIGSSRSEARQSSQSDTVRGSQVLAGGNVTLQASGAESDSDLLVRGSRVEAGQTTRLQAQGDITLEAAANTYRDTSSHSSKGSSVGMSFSAQGVSANASFSRASGQGNGEGTAYSNGQVGGREVLIGSGGDTTLQGAVVRGDQVRAQVGGDLRIHSLQDTDQYHEASRSTGVGISAPISGPGNASASLSLGRTRIDSLFRSVDEQSAIRAGDGGFQVDVGGNTSLLGGQITSSQAAVQQGRNRFDTGGDLVLSDLSNQAKYKASSTSVGLAVGGSAPGQAPGAGLSSVGMGSDGGSAQSTSKAGISGVAGDAAARTGDAPTGLKPIFDKQQVQQEVAAQVAITSEFGKRAVPAVAAYADEQAIALRREGREDEARRWDEGGEYRVAMHAGIGALTGGANGAMGSAASAVVAPVVGEAIAGMNLPEPVRQGLTTVTGALIGAAAGGSEGAAAAFTQTALNYVSHSPFAQVRRTVSQENARLMNACGTSCTADDLRRIDLQVAALERAGNLAAIAQRGGLSTDQARQLAQLATELLPFYGTGESMLQLLTGRSTVTQEEANRFWAAVGLVPVAGGIVRRVGEPSVEALSVIFRGGETIKPLADAVEQAKASSAAQGSLLREELGSLSKQVVDHSRDAEFMAKTDRRLLEQYNFDMDHVLAGEVNNAGRATGYHAEFAADGSARIKPGAQIQQNANGTYEAPVQVFDTKNGVWVDKFARSTFFPPDWSRARIEWEVSEAFKTGSAHTQFEASSPSGIKIRFNWDPKNQRTTFYPLGKP